MIGSSVTISNFGSNQELSHLSLFSSIFRFSKILCDWLIFGERIWVLSVTAAVKIELEKCSHCETNFLKFGAFLGEFFGPWWCVASLAALVWKGFGVNFFRFWPWGTWKLSWVFLNWWIQFWLEMSSSYLLFLAWVSGWEWFWGSACLWSSGWGSWWWSACPCSS